MISTPNAVILLPYIIIHENASLSRAFSNHTFLEVLKAAWGKVDW